MFQTFGQEWSWRFLVQIGACLPLQNALRQYCLNTREEMLFLAIREMLQLSILATKERFVGPIVVC